MAGWLAGTLDVRQGYCHLQGFQGHYRERFPPGGLSKGNNYCLLHHPPSTADDR
jgi:hypothetical protein